VKQIFPADNYENENEAFGDGAIIFSKAVLSGVGDQS
jgi:hypothetical protein